MFKYISIILSLAFASQSALAAEPLRSGVSTVDITPPKGYRMSGYFSERLNTGTHDPLHAKCLYFKQGNIEAALVFCDLIGIAPHVSAEARARAERETGIPREHILIAATHSHTGPLYFGALRQYFHDRIIAKEGKDPHEENEYGAMLSGKLVEAITTARKKAHAQSLSAGFVEQQGLSFNRRFHMKDGSVVFNPGKLNPNIVKAAGPIDPQVGLLMVHDGKTPVAALSVFALHLDTVGGTEYSADYPQYLEATLRKTYGEQFISLFGAGTCGDINHIDVTHNRPQKGQEEAQRIGEALGETVTAGLRKLPPPIASPSLGVIQAVVKVPLQSFEEDKIAWAKKQLDKVGTRELPFLAQVEAYKIMSVEDYRKAGDRLPIEVQVFRLSDDVAIVGLPGEVFVDLGLAIKQASPFKTTIIVELCNDAPGYIPTEKAFKEGSYETVNSRVAPGGGEAMAQEAIKLLKELKPAKN